MANTPMLSSIADKLRVYDYRTPRIRSVTETVKVDARTLNDVSTTADGTDRRDVARRRFEPQERNRLSRHAPIRRIPASSPSIHATVSAASIALLSMATTYI